MLYQHIVETLHQHMRGGYVAELLLGNLQLPIGGATARSGAQVPRWHPVMLQSGHTRRCGGAVGCCIRSQWAAQTTRRLQQWHPVLTHQSLWGSGGLLHILPTAHRRSSPRCSIPCLSAAKAAAIACGSCAGAIATGSCAGAIATCADALCSVSLCPALPCPGATAAIPIAGRGSIWP